jgi:hypothetical protein
METVELPDVYGYTLFCDDIRLEADGKFNFIGTYQSQMFVQGSFPVILPKFGFGISLLQRREHFVANAKILIFLPGDSDEAPSIQSEVKEAAEGPTLGQADLVSDFLTEEQKAYIALRANFVCAPLTINQSGTIKVRAVHKDRLIRLGSLAVIQPPQFKSPVVS